MKKIFIPILICFFFLVGCKKKAVPAELKIYDEAGNEQVLMIHATEDEKEILNLFELVDQSYLAPYSFSTAQINLNTALNGALIVDLNEKKVNIDLDYRLDTDLLLHFKSFRFTGSMELKGTDKTESIDFSSENQNHIKCDFQNDDAYIYLNGALLLGNNKINLRGKTSAEFLQQYKAYFMAFPELIRHKKLTYFLGDLERFTKDYQVSIIETTQDSFTIRLNVSAASLDPQHVLSGYSIADVEISCQNFLPISFSLSGNEIIEDALKKKYIEKYLTDQVSISKAAMELTGHIIYGQETLSLLDEAEKEKYTEFDWKSIVEQFKKYI